MSLVTNDTIHTHIRPPARFPWPNWSELWHARELVTLLVSRQIKIRYKQTALGPLWTIIPPIIHLSVFVVLFGKIAKLPSDGLPSILYYLAGLLIWRYFAAVVSSISNCLAAGANLIRKVYFPRLALALTPCFVHLIDLMIVAFILAVLCIYFQRSFSLWLLLIPIVLGISMLAALGTGLVFSGLTVRYRDLRSAVPMILQFWMYCTIIVPFSQFPEHWGIWRFIYGLNPIAGPVESLRYALNAPLTTISPTTSLILLGISAFSALVIFFIGLAIFSRAENIMADVL